jgi:hypothetical protein
LIHWFYDRVPSLLLLAAAGLVAWDESPEGAGVLTKGELAALVAFALALVEKAIWVETL